MEQSMFKSVGLFRAMEYLDSLKAPDGRTPVILEWLAKDLCDHEEEVVNHLTKMKNFREILISILLLMIKGDKRYSRNATYILSVLSETDMVKEELLLTKKDDIVTIWDTSRPKNLLLLISCVIHNSDEKSVVNTLVLFGNLLKMEAGLTWLYSHSSLHINDLLDDVISLVSSTFHDHSVHSSAEFIIARICSREEGRNIMCCNPFFDQLISHLIFSLESEDKEVTQNAAYALAELCHSPLICKVIINTQWATNLVENLIKLLSNDHIPIRVNSCNVLKSIVSSDEGFHWLNEMQNVEAMLMCIVQMLDGSTENKEIGFSAASFLKNFVAHQSGCLRINQSKTICTLLKHYESEFSNVPEIIKREISCLNKKTTRLLQPDPPRLTVQGPRSILINYIHEKNAICEIWQGTTIIHSGNQDTYLVKGLTPFTNYTFRLRLILGEEKGPFSTVIMAQTLEDEPGQCLNVSASSISCHQIQLSWNAPHNIYGLLKEYKVYKNGQVVSATLKNSVIVSGLKPQQRYKLEVSCVNGTYEGPTVSSVSKTYPEVYNATSKPSVVVLSDQELFVTWQRPARLLSRLIRYELFVNGEMVYSGTDTKYTVKSLTGGEMYEVMVAVVSTEVTCKSEVINRRTAKPQNKSIQVNVQQHNKRQTNSLHSSLQDLHAASAVHGSSSDLFSSSHQSPDHVSGQMMQNLLDQYSRDLSQSTPDLTDTHENGGSPIMLRRRNFHRDSERLQQNKRRLHNLVGSSWQHRGKQPSEMFNFSSPKAFNKQNLFHSRFSKPS